jgi:hypothetical protein
MKKNQQLISLGEQIHDAMKKFGAVRRTVSSPMPASVAPNMCGACVAASYLMAQEATKRGIPCEMIASEEHAFTMHDGLIYDPTYIQFEIPGYQEPSDYSTKVKVWEPGKIPEWVAHKYHSRFKTTKESVRWIKDTYPVSSVDGYQLDWISPTHAHISWIGVGHSINPFPIH